MCRPCPKVSDTVAPGWKENHLLGEVASPTGLRDDGIMFSKKTSSPVMTFNSPVFLYLWAKLIGPELTVWGQSE